VRDQPNLLQLTIPSVSQAFIELSSLYLCCTSRGVLNSSLSMKNYSRRFHLLLYLEEIQMEVDIRKYDLRNQTMTQDQGNRTLLILKVKSPHVLFDENDDFWD